MLDLSPCSWFYLVVVYLCIYLCFCVLEWPVKVRVMALPVSFERKKMQFSKEFENLSRTVYSIEQYFTKYYQNRRRYDSTSLWSCRFPIANYFHVRKDCQTAARMGHTKRRPAACGLRPAAQKHTLKGGPRPAALSRKLTEMYAKNRINLFFLKWLLPCGDWEREHHFILKNKIKYEAKNETKVGNGDKIQFENGRNR